MKDYNEMAESIFERRDKYNTERRRAMNKIKKRMSAAACCCLAVVIGLGVWRTGILSDSVDDGIEISTLQQGENIDDSVTQSGNNSEISAPGLTNLLKVNKADDLLIGDMDVEYTLYEKSQYDAWEKALEDFYEFTGISYDDFIAKIPNTWENSSFYSLSARDYKNDGANDEYRLHDYVFDYKTEDGKEAAIAICSFETPLRDYFVECDNPEQSEINGVPLVIYGYEQLYMVQFSYNNLNYDIQARGVTLEELEELLSAILA